MPQSFHLAPVGKVRKSGEKIWIEIFDDFRDGLLGIDDFSHIYVLYWFHENDTPENVKPFKFIPEAIRTIR